MTTKELDLRGQVDAKENQIAGLVVDVFNRLLRSDVKICIRLRVGDLPAMRKYIRELTFIAEMASIAVLCANAQYIYSRGKLEQMYRPNHPKLNPEFHKYTTEELLAYKSVDLAARQKLL
jgi:hypothetical protein